MEQKIVIGNWKMYTNLSDSLVLAAHLQESLGQLKGVEVVLAPPLSFLVSVREQWRIKPQHIFLAAQDIFDQNQGAYTGQVSAYLLKDLIEFALVGHSERRRYAKETNEQVREKVQACLHWQIRPVICVGEQKKMISATGTIAQEQEWAKVAAQLMESLVGVEADQLAKILVAYEPVWAIGTHQPATAKYVSQVVLRLKDKIAEKYSRLAAEKVRFLYGGSVDSQNSADFLRYDEIGGLLVGGASVKAKEFVQICQVAASLKG